MGKRGFTLTEILVTVAIIGLLAAIAIPAYIGQNRRATRSEAFSNLQNLRLLEEQFFAENGQYTTIGNLRGWRPGSGLKFQYIANSVTGVCMQTPVPFPYAGATQNLTAATTPCFIATATGIVGTRVSGEVFAIDCNNNRNF